MKNTEKKLSSLSFVAMLIISTFAFAFLIGGEIKEVDATWWNPFSWGGSDAQSQSTYNVGDSFLLDGKIYVKMENGMWETPDVENVISMVAPPEGVAVKKLGTQVATPEEIRDLENEQFDDRKLSNGGENYLDGSGGIVAIEDKKPGDQIVFLDYDAPTSRGSNSVLADSQADADFESGIDGPGSSTDNSALSGSGMPVVTELRKGKKGADKPAVPPVEVPTSGDRVPVKTIFGDKTPFAVAQIWEGAQWALIAGGAIKFLAPILGADEEDSNAFAISAMSGIFAGKLAYSFLGQKGGGGPLGAWQPKWATGKAAWLSNPATSVAIGATVAWVMYNSMYKKEKTYTETVSFQCLPWQAPNGGKDCELCNDKTGIPCSEYRCKSLGQSCSIINQGTSSERCVNTNPRDVSPPIIKPNKNSITEGYIYTDVKEMPPGAGFKIKSAQNSAGCIKPFTPIQFGIETDEPAQCKIDVEPKGNYSQMATYFGGDNLYSYNHTEVLSLPSTTEIKNSSLNLRNGQELSFFIRCKDSNGNTNEADYELKLCVDPSPDNTAPEIQGTNIVNGACIKSDADSASVDFYTNEPAECKWDFVDQDFDQMKNNMSCSNSIRDINALQVYTCSSQLTGIARDTTNFYVRCKDQPTGVNESKRNKNMDSYVYNLRGSEKLKLKNVKPNETVYGAVRPTAVELYAETLFGCDSNKAICYYSTTGEDGNFVQFFDTNKADGIHTQRLDLYDGNQKYYVRCIDSGGNLAESSVDFKVEIDTNAPIIARVLEEDKYLKIMTIRNSECVYTNDNCDFLFQEGTSMPNANSISHVVQWNQQKTYYIKCRDEFRTETADCSMIIKPVDGKLFN